MKNTEIIGMAIPEEASRIEKFAAGELGKYIHAMTNMDTNIWAIKSSKPAIYLGCFPEWMSADERRGIAGELADLHGDSFIIKTAKNSVIIYGKTPRATLYGVYDYLRILGVRWYFPSKEHEFIPGRKDVIPKNLNITKSPDMHHRSVVISPQNTAFQDWIDFAAKMKLNAIHIHSDEGINQLPDLMADRGLDFGLRRHFFGDTYSADDEDSLDKARKLILDYIQKLPPQMDEFFLWPADVILKLKEDRLSLPDVVLMFTNEMLKAIRTVKPNGRMSFLVYWSTWGVPEVVKPVDGVFPEIAPIHRCFSHAIADPSCAINSEKVLPVIKNSLNVFDPAEAHILGYWLDASLFGRSRYKELEGRLPQFGNIIKQDMKLYKSLGICNISTFAVGLNKEYFAKFASPTVFQYPMLLWNTESDLESELISFCRNYYGDESVSEAFQMSEQIEPMEASPDNWQNLEKRFQYANLIVKEAIQKSANDLHIMRLKKLQMELDFMSNWIGIIKSRPSANHFPGM